MSDLVTGDISLLVRCIIVALSNSVVQLWRSLIGDRPLRLCHC